jgi:heptosyltransferase-2
VLVNGSPAEAELTGTIASGINTAARGSEAIDLATRGITLGSLKEIVRRSSLMVTNDTGPRHIAAAFGVPVVSLFGPTDERWTRIPVAPGMETVLLADPGLTADEVADDFPERCRVDRISTQSVLAAAEGLLGRKG